MKRADGGNYIYLTKLIGTEGVIGRSSRKPDASFSNGKEGWPPRKKDFG
jgi:hypothetical protein